MRTMTLADAKAHLSAVVDQVQEGEEIVITRRGQPVARIIPECKAPIGNAAGLLKALRAHVMAQPMIEGNSVAAMREAERY